MAKAYSSWTVLPHQPIEKLADNLWRVSGKMSDGRVQRQMVLAKMGDGRVIVHNAIALNDDEMRELEAWGPPSVIFVPNGFHRQDALIWKQRYPKAQVIAPKGSKKRVEQVVAVDAVTEDAPHDDTVRLVPLDGVPMESVLEVRSGDRTSLVFCDAVLNMPKLGFPMNLFLGPTGRISAPRVMRLLALKDKRAFAAQLERLAETKGLERLLFGHGQPITDDCRGALQSVVTQLRG
ncbi:MAG: Methanol oxidation glmU-like protein [Deltaproteobacteria bacterium]|nr:Methanol oxidation glmU-like protein [Deltaproteobacteria bacterium]